MINVKKSAIHTVKSTISNMMTAIYHVKITLSYKYVSQYVLNLTTAFKTKHCYWTDQHSNTSRCCCQWRESTSTVNTSQKFYVRLFRTLIVRWFPVLVCQYQYLPLHFYFGATVVLCSRQFHPARPFLVCRPFLNLPPAMRILFSEAENDLHPESIDQCVESVRSMGRWLYIN